MITIDEIENAQREWADGIIALGRLKSNWDECRRAAEQFLGRLYGFNTGKVLFKPTFAEKEPYRFTKKAALSYFIGGYSNYPEDSGFVMKHWTTIQFENAGQWIYGDMAIVMGYYIFTDVNMKRLSADYTFGYIKKERLYISLHHSSENMHHIQTKYAPADFENQSG